jgi:hypothetical protein
MRLQKKWQVAIVGTSDFSKIANSFLGNAIFYGVAWGIAWQSVRSIKWYVKWLREFGTLSEELLIHCGVIDPSPSPKLSSY